MEDGEKSTSSVSKGCFLFNSGCLQPVHGKRKQNKSSAVTGHFTKFPLETDTDAEKRHEAFVSCWGKLKEKIDVIATKQHDKVFTDLLTFISTSNKQLDKLHQTSLSANVHRPPRLEIPTAVLVAGVNMPDHDVLFEQLRVMIRNDISPHVVLLKSSNCSTGMKATMKELLVQLSNGDKKAGQSSDIDETQSLSSPHKRPTLRLPLCSMDVLCSWYKRSCDAMSDHLTPTQSKVKHPPIVIVVEDFEAFSPPTMQDLIASISPHLPEFPVVLVLGVATSVRAIHCSLSRSASSLLCLEIFHTQHSALTLQQIIDETLMNTFPFKLGSKVLQFLLHQFFYCNFSLVNFTSGLKFAAMEHFYWQPLSVLYSMQAGVESTSHGKSKLNLNHTHCEMIRATPSFQKYVESQSPEQQILLLENDKELESVTGTLLQNLQIYHVCFFPLLECLHIFTRELPNTPLGRKSYELYLSSLEQNITNHPNFQEAWDLVNLMGREEFSACLKASIKVLESVKEHCESLSGHFEQFKTFLSQLESLSEHQPMEVQEDGESVSTQVTAAVNETTSERKMRFQERLRQVVSRKKEPSAYDLLRTTILQSILEILQKSLHCPSSFPLHEICYFDNVTSMKRQLAPAPRASLQTALSTPRYYLPSAGHVTEQSGLDGNMPDVCVAYQLHLECGRLINLYDWLQAFVAVVEQNEADNEGKTISSKEQNVEKNSDAKKSSTKQTEVDPVLHARFIQAVSELQFLGFIKPTQRKTDHVQRLTWGAC